MQFEEYKQIFEEMLAYSKEIVALYKKKQYDKADILFEKRNILAAKLDIPDDITEEQLNCIVEITNEIKKFDSVIAKSLADQKKEIKKQHESTLKEVKEAQAAEGIKSDMDIINPNKEYNNFGSSSGVGNSIFDFQKKRP